MSLLDIHAKVGPDGVLTLRVPLGRDQANRDVRVVVEPNTAAPPTIPPRMTPEEWRRWVEQMAGSWQGEFERPGPDAFEEREPLT